ncbi:MAG: 3-hydroxyisobutyryl-CoA hydrolase [Legionellaceae bacterium]|nr:3-hydroxyisobutyryl-CoA hydrolase [Legionellaceae bacterium]HAF87877.1 enoyl-CoA hydratase/isomerase family protein [Legionellales bacterium]HCA89486.1 enoyl-CoA hydratase/isomerase family protein [Legionellales bacterium]
MADIEFAVKHHLGLIYLNRLDALNALSLAMIEALTAKLLAWQADADIHAVVIQSAHDKVFCAGGDIKWLYHMGRQAKFDKQLHFFKQEYRLNYLISQYQKPYIALLDGLTLGGGVGIGLHTPFTVASEQFAFGMPETAIGFFPDVGAGYLLARCPWPIGVYLGLTGERLNAEQSRQFNLIQYRMSSKSLPALLDALITLDLTTAAHQQVKGCLERFASADAPALSCEKKDIESAFSGNTLQAIMHHLQHTTHGQADYYQLLQKRSPISLCVTLKHLQQARYQSLKTCLNQNYQLVQHFIHQPDFYEGIRALIIEKDHAPCWQPAYLEDIKSEQIAAYFVANAGSSPAIT